MENLVNTTHFSLFILTFLGISSLFWLVSRTLKEGRNALDELNKESK